LDFNALASNFGGSSRFWVQGDFNYDGTVSSLDFNAIAANFDLALPSPPALGTLVPEPVLASLMISAAWLRRPRRRIWASTGRRGRPFDLSYCCSGRGELAMFFVPSSPTR